MVRDLDIKNAGSVAKSMLPGGIWLMEHTGLEPLTLRHPYHQKVDNIPLSRICDAVMGEI